MFLNTRIGIPVSHTMSTSITMYYCSLKMVKQQAMFFPPLSCLVKIIGGIRDVFNLAI